MYALFRSGQIVKGKSSSYTITKQLYRTCWLALNNSNGESIVIKSWGHSSLKNERDVLQRFQARTPSLRPLVDEIAEPADPPAIALKHFDDNLLNASRAQKLTRSEIKLVSKSVLEALKVLHEDGYVHTDEDIKPDNVLVNYGSRGSRFAEVSVADCGNTYHVSSRFVKDRTPIGAAIWCSPEASIQMEWGLPTDIWSFGTILISLFFGGNTFIFNPNVDFDDESYPFEVLKRQYMMFGPYTRAYLELLTDPDDWAITEAVIKEVPRENMKPFRAAVDPEFSEDDKRFICRIMKLDPRDRPTARELLEDQWFQEDVALQVAEIPALRSVATLSA